MELVFLVVGFQVDFILFLIYLLCTIYLQGTCFTFGAIKKKILMLKINIWQNSWPGVVYQALKKQHPWQIFLTLESSRAIIVKSWLCWHFPALVSLLPGFSSPCLSFQFGDLFVWGSYRKSLKVPIIYRAWMADTKHAEMSWKQKLWGQRREPGFSRGREWTCLCSLACLSQGLVAPWKQLQGLFDFLLESSSWEMIVWLVY